MAWGLLLVGQAADIVVFDPGARASGPRSSPLSFVFRLAETERPVRGLLPGDRNQQPVRRGSRLRPPMRESLTRVGRGGDRRPRDRQELGNTARIPVSGRGPMLCPNSLFLKRAADRAWKHGFESRRMSWRRVHPAIASWRLGRRPRPETGSSCLRAVQSAPRNQRWTNRPASLPTRRSAWSTYPRDSTCRRLPSLRNGTLATSRMGSSL